MKIITILLLTFFYLIPVTGFSIDIHWCGNKIKSIGVEKIHKDKCPCGKLMPVGCCKDTSSFIKLTDNHKGTSWLTVPTNNFTMLAVEYYLPQINLFSAQISVFYFSKYYSPPFKSKYPVYLTNSIFRI
jgi:hypothetical protein